MKPTLVILAAGMASRFGSLKQIEGLGPSSETIIDYSIYDAIIAGFGKIVLVIREATHQHFEQTFLDKYGSKIELEFVDQELYKIPEGFEYSEERTKPWGTGHALLMAKEYIKEPFVVINGDDFYGREAFVDIVQHLQKQGQTKDFCMVGYPLKKTLSDFGTVSRGVCEVDSDNNLISITERTCIERINGKIQYKDEKDIYHPLPEDARVSMNFWGFQPDHFKILEDEFVDFLSHHAGELKSEFYIPTLVSSLIQNHHNCKVLTSEAEWFGITYKDDVENAKSRLKNLVENKVYPSPLW